MRHILSLLVCCALLWPAIGVSAQDKSEEDIIRELDVKGFKLGVVRGSALRPTEIASAAGLARAIPDKAAREHINKQIDWKKQELLYFAWTGSGTDRLANEIQSGEKSPEVVFNYTRGLTRDLRSHVHVFAVKKGIPWRIQTGKGPGK